MNQKKRRIQAQVETVLAVLTGMLALLTIFWKDWIEGLTGWDPDHHNGSAEVLIVIGLALVSALFGLLARRSWYKLATAGLS